MAWKSEELGRLTRDQKNKVLDDVFGDMKWIVPEILDHMREEPNLFFDGATQIRMDTWSQGRVALVGDACQCLTLLAGQGASFAMAGAYTLAMELNKSGGDYQRAYQNYQAQLKPVIDQRQIQARKIARTFVPDNQWEVFMTNLLVGAAFLPGFKTLFRNSIGAESIIH
jgi:2-polyprenyl-6-methoxyphenol hydroxylase-like FAD-dependent oxidoreductase